MLTRHQAAFSLNPFEAAYRVRSRRGPARRRHCGGHDHSGASQTFVPCRRGLCVRQRGPAPRGFAQAGRGFRRGAAAAASISDFILERRLRGELCSDGWTAVRTRAGNAPFTGSRMQRPIQRVHLERAAAAEPAGGGVPPELLRVLASTHWAQARLPTEFEWGAPVHLAGNAAPRRPIGTSPRAGRVATGRRSHVRTCGVGPAPRTTPSPLPAGCPGAGQRYNASSWRAIWSFAAAVFSHPAWSHSDHLPQPTSARARGRSRDFDSRDALESGANRREPPR